MSSCSWRRRSGSKKEWDRRSILWRCSEACCRRYFFNVGRGYWSGAGYRVVDRFSAGIMTVLAASRHASALSTLLAIAAMFIYPGGSIYHRDAGHYTFFKTI